MKKTYLSKFALYGLPLIVVIMMIAVNSCKKDLRANAANLKPASSGDTSLTAQAKAWYQNNYPDVKTTAKTQSFGTAPAVQDWSKTFSPYWAQAQTFVADSMTIIELPALKKGNMAMMPNKVNTQGYDFSKSPSITSILIVIYKGYINAYAMTIMGDSSYLNGNYAKLKNNTYRKKDKNFSGMIFYNAMDGTFINGWRMVNGAVTNAIHQVPASTAPVIQSITRGPKINVTQQCTVTITQLWESCSYYVTDVDDTDPFDCYYYNVSTSYDTTCGTTTTTTSPGGGTPVTPPVPKCQPPTVQVDAFTGHLKINVAAPPPTSPTAPGTPQPAPQPCPTSPTDTVVKQVQTNPCTQVNALAKNSAFIALMNNLKNNTSQNYEDAYTFDIDQNGNMNSENSFEGLPDSSSVTVTFPTGAVDGYAHDHYVGDFPTFSGDDILQIYKMVQANAINNESTFTAAVVTASGTSYLIKISNPTEFAAFAQANLLPSNIKQFENYYEQSEQKYELLQNSRTTSYELGLLDALQNSGLTLFKGNSTFTSWTPIINTNNTETVTNCNSN